MNLQDFKDQLNKFSIAQMLSNSDGKTSSSATMGCLIIVTGCIGFLLGVVDKAKFSGTTDIMMYSSGLVVTGAGLIGYRKSKEGTSTSEEAVIVSSLPKQE